MCKAANIDKVRKCNVVYSHIPELYEQPTITEDKPVAHKYNMNKCTYTASVSEAWQTLMEKSGFEIMVNLYPQTPLILAWTLRENNAQWDENTRYGLEGPTCTLYYKETAVDTGLKPELEAQVTILLPEQGNLRATATEYSWKTKTETKYGWESTVSMDKTMNSLNRKVPMNKDQEELGLEQQAAFDLEWIPSSLIKQKKAPFMLPSKLMSDMVIRQPLAGTANVAVEAGEHIIGSVRQVSDLSTKITKLNQSPINARLKTVVPEAS